MIHSVGIICDEFYGWLIKLRIHTEDKWSQMMECSFKSELIRVKARTPCVLKSAPSSKHWPQKKLKLIKPTVNFYIRCLILSSRLMLLQFFHLYVFPSVCSSRCSCRWKIVSKARKHFPTSEEKKKKSFNSIDSYVGMTWCEFAAARCKVCGVNLISILG